MSERLAVSAAFSVLLMATYVLFGAEAQRIEFGPTALPAPYSAPAAMHDGAPLPRLFRD